MPSKADTPLAHQQIPSLSLRCLGQPTAAAYTEQENCLTLKYGTDTLSRNIDKELPAYAA